MLGANPAAFNSLQNQLAASGACSFGGGAYAALPQAAALQAATAGILCIYLFYVPSLYFFQCNKSSVGDYDAFTFSSKSNDIKLSRAAVSYKCSCSCASKSSPSRNGRTEIFS